MLIPLDNRALAHGSAHGLRACLAALTVCAALGSAHRPLPALPEPPPAGPPRPPASHATSSAAVHSAGLDEGDWAIVGIDHSWPLRLETLQMAMMMVTMSAGIRGGRLSWVGSNGERTLPTDNGDPYRSWQGGEVTSVQEDEVIIENAPAASHDRMTLVRAETARHWQSFCLSADTTAVARRESCRAGEEKLFFGILEPEIPR